MRGVTACLCVCVENDEKRWTKCCRVFVYISTHTHTHTQAHRKVILWSIRYSEEERWVLRKDWGCHCQWTDYYLCHWGCHCQFTTTEGVTVSLLPVPLRVSLSVYYLCHWGCHCHWNGYYLCHWRCHCQFTTCATEGVTVSGMVTTSATEGVTVSGLITTCATDGDTVSGMMTTCATEGVTVSGRITTCATPYKFLTWTYF